MDSNWFKEDRVLPAPERESAKAETEKALRNSTLLNDRLQRILKEKLKKSYTDDEDFSKPNWELEHVANISRRKVLLEVLNLLNFK